MLNYNIILSSCENRKSNCKLCRIKKCRNYVKLQSHFVKIQNYSVKIVKATKGESSTLPSLWPNCQITKLFSKGTEPSKIIKENCQNTKSKGET